MSISLHKQPFWGLPFAQLPNSQIVKLERVVNLNDLVDQLRALKSGAFDTSPEICCSHDDILRNASTIDSFVDDFFDNYKKNKNKSSGSHYGESASTNKEESHSGYKDSNFSSSSSNSSSSLSSAYSLIGGSPNMTIEEIKSAYRNQAKAYHPDVLSSKGIPQDLIDIANAKMIKLNEAWDIIQKERGISL